MEIYQLFGIALLQKKGVSIEKLLPQDSAEFMT